MAAWPEPLIAATAVVDDYTVAVTVATGDVDAVEGTAVAHVLCAHSPTARYGIFGEMQITDAGGAPRQRMRALVLLVREALRYAAEIGVVRAHTEAPPRMAAFASRMCGLPGAAAGGGRLLFRGEVHAMRSAALDASDAGGNFAAGDSAAATGVNDGRL